MSAYYNEHNRHAAQRIRDHIAAGLLAPGDVDERSIEDIRPDELVGYTQCHFFAGIGTWSAALRNADWADDRPIWTGSCPCQPFSGAGKGEGFADERHLWPAWFHLIEQCQPAAIFGEQVGSAPGLLWLDLVSADMEAAGYAFGVADLCAASVGAPHIRQRLFWVADSGCVGDECGGECRDAHATDGPAQGQAWQRERSRADAGYRSATGGLGEMPIGGRREQRCPLEPWEGRVRHFDCSGNARGFWADADLIPCKDGKHRPVEPGTFPLVDGAPARMERLRQYGNGIVLPLATEFIASWMDCRA